MDEMFWLVLGFGLILLVKLTLIFKEVFKKLEATNFILARSEIKLDDIIKKLISANSILGDIRSKTSHDAYERTYRREDDEPIVPKPKKRNNYGSSAKDDLFV